MNIRNINPEKYGMVFCPCCNGDGFTQNPTRQCCPKCGGFGLVKKEAEEDTRISASKQLPKTPRSED